MTSTRLEPSQPTPLAGVTVLIVEDNPFIAMDLAATARSGGASVLGPFANLANACAAIEEETPDLALLDVDLGGETSLPLADILTERQVPFLFHTGNPGTAELASYGVPIVSKPVSVPTLLRELAAALGRTETEEDSQAQP